MMQQVATSGSEIAALKGKAGKGAESGEEQGSAFDTMFQQAKSPSRKENANEASSTQTSHKTVTAKESANASDPKNAAARDSSNMPDTDTARSQSSGDVAEPETEQKSDKILVKGELVVTDDKGKNKGTVEPHIPDDGNLVSMEPNEIKMTWDDWLAAQEGELDWRAYVDAVRKAKGEVIVEPGHKIKNGDDGEISPVIPSPVSDDSVAADTEAEQSGSQIVAEEGQLQANIAVLSEDIMKSVNESGNGKQEILSIVEKLTELLAKQSQQESDGSKTQAEMTEQIKALTAQLTETLKGAEGAQSDAVKAEATGKNVSFDIEGLIASFKGEPSEEAGPEIQQSDAELLLDLIKAEISTAAKEGTDKAVVATPSEQQPGSDGDSAVEDATVMRRMMNDMLQLSDESRGKITQSLADKVVALLPPSASDQQQQTVKQAVIAGVQELQSQLSQGHEPGIDLKAIIADAIKEANIPVTTQMMAQAEQQVSQLHQLLSTAQSAAHQTVTSQMASADTMIQENTQVRSEATKSQHQADSMDKPVNITKAEGLQQLNEKIRWMMSARNMMAEIRLDPPELGSMQVRVNMSGDTASVNFVVQSQQARDALADATPRLRDMLAEQGIELGESFVQQQSGGQGEAEEKGDGNFAGNGSQSGEDDDSQIIEQPVTRESMGGIDYYA